MFPGIDAAAEREQEISFGNWVSWGLGSEFFSSQAHLLLLEVEESSSAIHKANTCISWGPHLSSEKGISTTPLAFQFTLLERKHDREREVQGQGVLKPWRLTSQRPRRQQQAWAAEHHKGSLSYSHASLVQEHPGTCWAQVEQGYGCCRRSPLLLPASSEEAGGKKVQSMILCLYYSTWWKSVDTRNSVNLAVVVQAFMPIEDNWICLFASRMLFTVFFFFNLENCHKNVTWKWLYIII